MPVVVRFGRVGDMIVLEPLLSALHARYQQPCHVITVGQCATTLYANHPSVGRVIACATQRGPLWLDPQRMQTARAIAAYRQSPFFICEPAPRMQQKVQPMLAMARIPRDHCVFIDDLPEDDEHQVDRLLRFSRSTPAAFHAPAAATGPMMAAPHLSPSDAERADIRTWLRQRQLAGTPLILVQPSNKRTMRWNGVRKADDDSKSWPIERWAALIRGVVAQRPDATVVLCGAPHESAYLQTIKAAVPEARVEIAAHDLPLGRLRALLEIAHSMISVDTGPAHLAAAVGCPLVVLFGACSPAYWAPRSACGSPVVCLGGAPHTQRVDQLDVEQVLARWRGLDWRQAVSAEPVAASAIGAAHG
jgi:heptosyltransferase-2/heptosyltransferase-3